VPLRISTPNCDNRAERDWVRLGFLNSYPDNSISRGLVGDSNLTSRINYPRGGIGVSSFFRLAPRHWCYPI